ncbi:hypothetical protein MAH1_24170 [Sessilibacter sp. MAH1]
MSESDSGLKIDNQTVNNQGTDNQEIGHQSYVIRFFYGGFARLVSFVLAILLAGVAMIVPQLIAEEAHEVNHSLLMLSMLGISGGFIHGVGFVPRHWFWWALFSPFVAWPILFLSIYWWF